LAFLIGPLLGISALLFIGKAIYPEPQRLVLFYAIMLVFIVAFDRVIAWRVRRKFESATAPEITTSAG
jgi:hypothetical protein